MAIVLAVFLRAALAPAVAPVPVLGSSSLGSGAAPPLGGLRGFLAGLRLRGRGILFGALIATSTILSGRWSLGFCSARRFFSGRGFLLRLVAGDGFISLLFSNVFNGLLTVARFQAVAQLVVGGVDAHDAQDFILFGLGFGALLDCFLFGAVLGRKDSHESGEGGLDSPDEVVVGGIVKIVDLERGSDQAKVQDESPAHFLPHVLVILSVIEESF